MSDRYNVLLITADQYRADCLGAAGHPLVQTPHLDQLAYQGTLFESAYADCPICIPSRCSLISGLHAWTYGRPYFFSHEPFPIDRSRTLMSMLTSAGYQTQAVGKMHFFPERACYGFENMILDLDYAEWLRDQGYGSGAFTSRGVGLNEFWPTSSITPAHMTDTAWTVDESIRFLRRRDPDRPFFLWTSFHAPHPPLHPPEPYFSMYRPEEAPERVVGDWVDNDPPLSQRLHRETYKYDLINDSWVAKIRSCYYGALTEIDHQLGRLLGVLAQSRLLDQTLIVFTSDHGEMLGDHRDFGKTSLYDAAARVPLIVRWPRGFLPRAEGRSSSLPTALVDIMPTVLDVAGAEPVDGIDGRSLVSVAEADKDDWRPYLKLRVDTAQGVLGLTDGREKYLWHRWGGQEQLFSLTSDRRETTDLTRAGDHEATTALWRARMVEWLTQTNYPGVVDGTLSPVLEPYPDDSAVRARNPLGWSYDRPFS